MRKLNIDIRLFCWFIMFLLAEVRPIVKGLEEWQVYQVVGREAHNRIRAKHNAPPLKLNETLNKAAQNFAEHMLNEKTVSIRRTYGFTKNQQAFKTYPEAPLNANDAVKKAVSKWYSVITRSHWNNPNYTAFSALAWKGTTDLGIGVAANGSRTIVIAAYSHPEDSGHEVNEIKSRFKSKSKATIVLPPKTGTGLKSLPTTAYAKFEVESRGRVGSSSGVV